MIEFHWMKFLFHVYVGQLTEAISAIRAVTLTRRIVIGTRGGEICEIEKDGRIRVVVQGLKRLNDNIERIRSI